MISRAGLINQTKCAFGVGLTILAAWGGAGGTAETKRFLAGEEPCGPTFPDYPELLPPLTPPAEISQIHIVPPQTGTTIVVGEEESIQAAIDSASPGDTILLNGESFRETVTLRTSDIRIIGVSSSPAIWLGEDPNSSSGPPSAPGSPALIIEGAVNIVLDRLQIEGSGGISYGPNPFGGFYGGDGGAAIVLTQGASVNLRACQVIGGDGGNGEGVDTICGNYGGGGDGAPAILIGEGSVARADSASSFGGGLAGMSSLTTPFQDLSGGEDGCCGYAAPHGSHASPVQGEGEFVWVDFLHGDNSARNWERYE